MKPYDTFDNVTVEIIAIHPDKKDMLVWRCTEEQGNDWKEIKNRVTGHGYTGFEKRTIKEKIELFDLEENQ